MLRLSMQAVLRTSQSKLHATPFLHPHPSLNASPLLLRAVSTVVPVHTTPRKKKRKGNSPQHASKPSSHPHPNQKTSLVNKSNASVLGSTNATQEKLQEPSTVVEPAAATTPSDKDVPQPATSGTPKRGDHHASSSTDLVVSATQPSTKGHAQKKAAIATKPPTSPLVEEAQVVIGLLEEIAQRQRALPSAAHVTTMLNYTSRDQEDTFFKLFELYRKHGNSNVDSTFLIPGVVKCCEVGNSKQAVAIATDMVNNGRKVDRHTLHLILRVAETNSAARDALKVLDLLLQEGHLVTTQDYQRILAICTADHHEDGALRILQALRPLTTIASDTYLHWLSRSAMVWRADIFLALLQEMRLSGVEPRIPSLTSLEVGRKDPALTVMEGVRAVGLDPCFAMSAVYESIAKAIGKGDRRDGGVTRRQRETALEKFGTLKVRKLEWEVQPIPQLLETQAAGLLLKKETFRRLKYQQVTRVESYLNMLPITTNVTLNLRKQLLRMSLLVNTHRVKRNKYMILGEYERGKSLIDLSNIHNYPPVSLMRIILEARGMSPRAIKNALAAPGDLTPRDNNELNRAKLNDSIHRNDPLLDLPDYTSSSLETTLMHYFISKGIRVSTQAELALDQEKIYGRAVISPDLLLLDPVLINGVPVRWIDAKNYYGAHIVNKRLIAKQLASYVKEWGPGAVVYGMGYSDMISIPGVVCLDMTPIPKTSWGKFKMVTKSYMYTFRNLFRWAPHLGSELTQEYLTSNDLTEVNRERGAQERLERSAAKSAKNPVAAEKKEVE